MAKHKGTKDVSPGKNVNICTGCSHDCIYCYAKESALRYGHISSVDEWKTMKIREKDVNHNFRKKWSYAPLFPSSHDITPEILDSYLTALGNFLEPGNKVNIVSKPHLECVKAIYEEYGDHYNDKIQFMFTFTAKDDKILSFWEPNAPGYKERKACLKYVNDAGFNTRVFIEPVLDPDNLEDLVEDLLPFITIDLWIGKMNHVGRIKKMYPDNQQIHNALDTLQAKYTDERMIGLFNYFRNDPFVKWKTGTLPDKAKDDPLFKWKTGILPEKAVRTMPKKGAKKITKYQLHPVASAFPEMPNSAFEELKRSIRQNGLRHPIVLYDGKIIDGKTRYEACVELGIEPKTTEWDGNGSLTDFVCDMNINRRDLDRNQRYAIALKLKQSYAKEAKENQRLSKGRGKKGSCLKHKPIDARKMACKKARIGEKTLAAVEELHEKARDLFDSVFSEGTSLAGAMRTLEKRENPDYFEDVIGHLFIEWALPEDTWLTNVSLDRSTQTIKMRVRHRSENGLKEAVMEKLARIPVSSLEFHPLDDMEKHMMGLITTEEALQRAEAKQVLQKMKGNIEKFRGRVKQERPIRPL